MSTDATPPAPPKQANNPLHGKTLEAIVTELAGYYGWDGLGERIPVRCFTFEPSVGSSLKFCAKPPGLGTRWRGCTCSCCGKYAAQGARPRRLSLPASFSIRTWELYHSYF